MKEVFKTASNYYEKIKFNKEKDCIASCNMNGNHFGMENFFCSSIIQSHNLVNSAHYDLDASISIATWTETIPGLAKGLYFVLPNLTKDGTKGIAIELFHGITIQWDGRLLWHCTAMESAGEGNNVFGTFFAAK